MPWLIVGMSMFASLTSATTFMGVPGLAYGGNVAIFFGVLISPLVAPVIILTFYPFYRRLNVTTSYQYIFNRYGRNARVAVSSLFLLSRVGWLGVVIYAPALALHTAIGMELWVAILLMGVLSTAYTVMGGLRAVLWTDVVQFVILAGGAVWVAVSLVNNVGFSEIISQAKGAGKFDVFLWSSDFDFKKMFAISAAFAYFFIFMQNILFV